MSFLLLVGFTSLLSWSSQTNLFQPGESCVAWQAQKRMYMIRKVNPVGMNCKLQIEMNSVDKKTYRFLLKAAIKDFNSGEAERDEAVFNLLKGKKQPRILITTEPMDSQAWHNFLNNPKQDMQVKLSVAEQTTLIHAHVFVDSSAEGYVIRGQVPISLKSLGLTAPEVGYGVITKVSDNMELHFQIQSNQIKDIDQVLK